MHVAADRSHDLEVKVIDGITSIYSQHFRTNNEHTLYIKLEVNLVSKHTIRFFLKFL